MFRHTLLLAYRSFLRFKSTFFINLIGLSTGLACALFIYLWVSDELRVDTFHEKGSRLFQALLNHHNTGGIETAHATPALLAESLADEMPEVEYAVATTSGISFCKASAKRPGVDGAVTILPSPFGIFCITWYKRLSFS